MFSRYMGVFVMQGWNPIPGWMLRVVRVDPEARQHPARFLLVFLTFNDMNSSLVSSQLVPLAVSCLFGGVGSLDFVFFFPTFSLWWFWSFGALDFIFSFSPFSGGNLWELILSCYQLLQKWCMQCGNNFIC